MIFVQLIFGFYFAEHENTLENSNRMQFTTQNNFFHNFLKHSTEFRLKKYSPRPGRRQGCLKGSERCLKKTPAKPGSKKIDFVKTRLPAILPPE